jgi:16S rRNA (cytosine1402-N4)-methyltransferase
MHCYHVPVLVQEVIEFLRPQPKGIYLDGTVGTGGHAEVLLTHSSPTGRVIGIDTDRESLEVARQRLARFGERVTLFHGRYEEAGSFLKSLGLTKVHGVLLDLGLSSYQLEMPGRGFSFQREDPLDMRMDRSQGSTASEFLKTISEKELAETLRDYGEERWARRIARATVKRFSAMTSPTAKDLAEIVLSAIPPGRRRQRIHPATRTFQALRIALNRELEALREILNLLPSLMYAGGRACIISFHSLEDRIVKHYFSAWEKGCLYGSDASPPVDKGVPLGHLVHRKVIRPTYEEILRNPRARSARMRVIEIL